MNGGKRGSKRNYDYLHDESFGKPVASKPPKLAEVTIPDPYPNSLVIRIKFKNKGISYYDVHFFLHSSLICTKLI